MRFLAFFWLVSFPAFAQIAPVQLTLLEASQAVMAKDYAKAEQLYSKAMAQDPTQPNTYIQRAVVYREMSDTSRMQADARTAISLANVRLGVQPSDAKAMWQRGMGFRLLKDFPQARRDLESAIRLSGSKGQNWQSDLQALNLEEKMG